MHLIGGEKGRVRELASTIDVDPYIFFRWVLQKFYKAFYDWFNSCYLICITIGTILFKTKYLPELCKKIVFVFCFLDNMGIPIQALLTNSMLAFPQNIIRPINDDLVKLLQYCSSYAHSISF